MRWGFVAPLYAREGDGLAGGPASNAVDGRLDEGLHRALLAGDEAAEMLFFTRFSPAIERLLRRMLGAGPDCEEAVVETFHRALDRIADLTAPAGCLAWLRRIAVFVAHEALRRRKRDGQRRAELPEDGYERIGDDRPDPSDGRAALARLNAILDDLDPESKLLFVLRFVEGEELTAVAAATDLSLATVKRKLAKVEERVHERARRDELLKHYVPRPLAGDFAPQDRPAEEAT
jgi:RNA polymerase sigma-70 factor (ECF subfamily)